MTTQEEFAKTLFDLRSFTTTLENLQGQIYDGSYRTGSLMIFRAMVMGKELEAEFSEEKFADFKEKLEEISVFIDELIKSPTIFGTYLQ